MSVRSDSWVEEVDERALACAINGDCIFDEVKAGVSEIERAWRNQSKDWFSLLEGSTKRFFGLIPTSDPRWLYHTLFQPPKNWPKGLSWDDKATLRLARSLSAFHPSPVRVDRSRGLHYDPSSPQEAKVTLDAMKKYAEDFRKKIAFPMYREYNKIAEKYGEKIQSLCDATYGEPCSRDEAIAMFKGDLQRGWRVGTLMTTPSMDNVLPEFLDWVSA